MCVKRNREANSLAGTSLLFCLLLGRTQLSLPVSRRYANSEKNIIGY